MNNDRIDIQTQITNSIVAALEEGAGTFELPWHKVGLSSPINYVSENTYRGVNFLCLMLTAHARGYSSNRWATYKQWSELGAKVRKGERGTPIVFYKLLTRQGDEQEAKGEADLIPLLRHSHVFNVAQVEGIEQPAPVGLAPTSQIELEDGAEAVVKATGAIIKHQGNMACYRPSSDEIHMPPLHLWKGSKTASPTEAYYATIFHELAHWSGAKHRLNRNLTGSFADQNYCLEELCAELTAAFCCVELGITPTARPDHAAYIAQYIELLKSDKRAIFKAASAASQAMDYILLPSKVTPMELAA